MRERRARRSGYRSDRVGGTYYWEGEDRPFKPAWARAGQRRSARSRRWARDRGVVARHDGCPTAAVLGT